MMQTMMVTGGCGFIGSALVRNLVADGRYRVVNVDCLTYAGNELSLGEAAASERHVLERVDIRDGDAVRGLFERYRPDAVLHLAAESHVDRSIDDAAPFITTNIVGSYILLDAATRYRNDGAPEHFRFVHVSTDEVYGALGDEGEFTEDSPYDPCSPYAASKASSDMLARAWQRTYGLPVVITNCSNNYGPYQYPEKLIPLMIRKALAGEPLPVYGTGANVRDWLHVDDHCRALVAVAEKGTIGKTYLIGSRNEQRNIDVVHTLCAILDAEHPRADGQPYAKQITFVADRPGHDHRYAIDPSLLERDLGWAPGIGFAEGLRDTVRWYLNNEDWCEAVSGSYRSTRLGLGRANG